MPPIVAATVLNIFLFAGAWKAGQVEKRTGAVPWYMYAGSVAYGLPLLVFLYYAQTRPLNSALDIFGVALVAEGMGAALVHGMVRELITAREQTWKERAPMLGICALLLFVVVTLAL